MAVDHSKITRFRDSFHAVVYDISKGLFNIQSAADNGHWAKWAILFRGVALKPYSYHTGTRSPFPMPLHGNTGQGKLHPANIRYDTTKFGTTYFQLARLSPFCGTEKPSHEPRGTGHPPPLPVLMLHKAITLTK